MRLPPPASRLWAWLAERRDVVVLILIAKAAVLGGVALIDALLPGLFMERIRNINFVWQLGLPVSLQDHYLTWDAQHFLALASGGYAGAPRSITYPPLWPALIRATAWVTGLSLPLAALATANVLSFCGLMCFHRLVERGEGRSTADAAVALMLAFPTSFFLCLPYAEGLFLLLVCGTLLLAGEGRFGWAALLAALATSTRAVGVTLFVVFLVAAWEQRRPRIALVGLGTFAGYFVHPLMVVGSGYSLAQLTLAHAAYKAQPSILKVFEFWKFLPDLGAAQALHRPYGSLLDRIAFVLAFGGAALDLGRNRGRALWSAAIAYVPAATASFVSSVRYSLLVLSLHVTLARHAGPRRALLAALVLAGAMAQAVLLLMHTLNLWVG